MKLDLKEKANYNKVFYDYVISRFNKDTLDNYLY